MECNKILQANVWTSLSNFTLPLSTNVSFLHVATLIVGRFFSIESFIYRLPGLAFQRKSLLTILFIRKSLREFNICLVYLKKT